jgi:hypothetical protein
MKDQTMSSFEEETVTALRALFEKVETLQTIDIGDMLNPGTDTLYEQALQAAYDALTQVEDALDTLGQKLEYHHWRLGEAVEEIKKLNSSE